MHNTMSGFGRGRATEGSEEVALEIRTENHALRALRVELPWALTHLEAEIADAVKQRVRRGSVHVRAEVMPAKVGKRESEVVRLLNIILQHGLRMRRLKVVTEHEVDRAAAERAMREALERALRALAESRANAGVKVVAKVRENLQAVELQLGVVRLLVSGGGADVKEELDLLEAHLQHAREVLERDGEVGVDLDAVCLGMQRELKTVTDKWGKPAAELDELRRAILRVKEQSSNLE